MTTPHESYNCCGSNTGFHDWCKCECHKPKSNFDAHALAEKIWNDTVNTVTAEEFIPIAESLLAEAMEEDHKYALDVSGFVEKAKAAAYEEGAKHQFSGDKEHYESRIKQAVDLAYEDAATIAELYHDVLGGNGIADMIRQRAKEIK